MYRPGGEQCIGEQWLPGAILPSRGAGCDGFAREGCYLVGFDVAAGERHWVRRELVAPTSCEAARGEAQGAADGQDTIAPIVPMLCRLEKEEYDSRPETSEMLRQLVAERG